MSDDETPQKTSILDEVSFAFIKSVDDALGAQKSQEVVKALSEILGKDWRNSLIYHKMSSTFQGTKISLILDDQDAYETDTPGGLRRHYTHKINSIKELRSMTGLGLMESKAAIERAEDEVVTVTLDSRMKASNPRAWEQNVLASVKVLRGYGFKVVYS